MDKELEKRIKNFSNFPDREKLAILIELSDHLENTEVLNFLYNVVENDKYEKIRIKSILILKTRDDEETVRKLSELYAYERERSVRLALVEAIADMTSGEIDALLQSIAKKDDNDIIRSIAVKNLHERKKIGKANMRTLLLEIIQQDSSAFPKQISLNLISLYADKKTLEVLKSVFEREKKYKMKKLIHQTMSEVAEKVKVALDIDEPIEKKVEEEKRKRGRRRRLKKKKDDEEHLFF